MPAMQPEPPPPTGGGSRAGCIVALVVAVALGLFLFVKPLRSLIWPCGCDGLTCGQQSSRALLSGLGFAVGDCGICEPGGGCCEPQCDGKCLGADDACGGTCNTTCSSSERCDNGKCVCTPQCTTKCGGDDGCGGKCEDNCPAPAHCGNDNTSCVTQPSYALCGPGAGCGSDEPLHVEKGPTCTVASSAGTCRTTNGDCYVCPSSGGESVAVCGPGARCRGRSSLAVTQEAGSCGAAASGGTCKSTEGTCAVCSAPAGATIAVCGPGASCVQAQPLAGTSAQGTCSISASTGVCQSESLDALCQICVMPKGRSSEALCAADVECEGKPLAMSPDTGACMANATTNRCSEGNGQCAVCPSQ